jgi:phosphoribosylglycinamide formyltransferase-1
MEKIKLAILISGRGSNMEAILKACRSDQFPAEVDLVISDKPDAPGLEIARRYGVYDGSVEHPSRQYFAAMLGLMLDSMLYPPDLICLAGFMRILDAEFVNRWKGRIINIHPSLLPAFPGLHPHRQAIEAGATMSGCTVHWVTPEVDAGPIISQMSVPVLPGDTPETLADRILAREHQLYPLTIKMLALKMLAERQSELSPPV